MKQYQELLKTIKENGTWKKAARENMPRTKSLFGYQMRFNLQEGFPIVTTKKVSFKNILNELIFFLKGVSNIQPLVDQGCNIWTEDAFNFYLKLCKREQHLMGNKAHIDFDLFCDLLKGKKLPPNEDMKFYYMPTKYKLGDLGVQYPTLWRNWESIKVKEKEGQSVKYGNFEGELFEVELKITDQIKDLIESLKSNPEGRRQMVTAWKPEDLDNMALNSCHVLFQFNCRELTESQRWDLLPKECDKMVIAYCESPYDDDLLYLINQKLIENKTPKYYLDCHLYQRSADSMLGIPYNITSYVLLTHIIAKICNFVVGDFIHTFGDVHIYENHLEAVEEQLQREPKPLPTLKIERNFEDIDPISDDMMYQYEKVGCDKFFAEVLETYDFELLNYESHPKLKSETELSTGLKK